jgi:hypothetical protein
MMSLIKKFLRDSCMLFDYLIHYSLKKLISILIIFLKNFLLLKSNNKQHQDIQLNKNISTKYDNSNQFHFKKYQ